MPTRVGAGPDGAAVCLKPRRHHCRMDVSIILGTGHVVSPGCAHATPAPALGPAQPRAPRQVGLVVTPAEGQP